MPGVITRVMAKMRAESGRDVQALSNSFNARFNYLYLYTMKKALLILLTLLTLTSMGYSQNSSINSEENRIATNDVFVYCEQKNEKPVLDLKGRMLYYVVQENKFEIYSGKTFSDAVAAGKLEVSVNFTIVENGIILEGRNRNVQYNFDEKGNLKGEKIMGVGMMFKRANEKFIPKIEIQGPPLIKGGYIVYEKNGHGLVAAPKDLGRMTWEDAVYGCDELTLNGYSDWRLPTKEELKQLYLNKDKIVGFFANSGGCGDYVLNSVFDSHCIYWSSTGNDNGYAWLQDFSNGLQSWAGKKEELNIRAVRAF